MEARSAGSRFASMMNGLCLQDAARKTAGPQANAQTMGWIHHNSRRRSNLP
jgi:hypothetical protein